MISCLLSFALVLLMTLPQQPVATSDADWKAWLELVRPLMAIDEQKLAKKVDATDREVYRAEFWRRRDPDRSTLGNEFKTEFERRVRAADQRFRTSGKWNACGVTFVLLGKPDLVRDATTTSHFAAPDRLEAMREQDDTLAEIWFYRNPPELPQSPQGYRFRFTRGCESLDGSSVRVLLERVAELSIRQR
jgi:GWxTD domain-containing protein